MNTFYTWISSCIMSALTLLVGRQKVIKILLQESVVVFFQDHSGTAAYQMNLETGSKMFIVLVWIGYRVEHESRETLRCEPGEIIHSLTVTGLIIRLSLFATFTVVYFIE